MSAAVVEWICKELSKLLGIETSEDVATYIMSFTSFSELEDYLFDFVDPKAPKTKRFIEELKIRWQPAGATTQAYKKSEGEATYYSGTGKKGKGKKADRKDQKGSIGADNKENVLSAAGISQVQEASSDTEIRSSESTDHDVKTKTKFVPLFSEAGHARSVARLPGRHPCECLASKHKLVNNCLKCGRIVCEQEGSGPCLFCGNLVCTGEEESVLSRVTKKSDKLREQLMGGQFGNLEEGSGSSQTPREGSLKKAVELRDKLLEFDKTSAKRTQVVDDESDYFSADANLWLSQSEREALKGREAELRATRHAPRRDRKVTLDFAGRRIVDAGDASEMYDANDSVVQSVYNPGLGLGLTKDVSGSLEEKFGDLVNPNIARAPPKFVSTAVSDRGVSTSLGSKAATDVTGSEKRVAVRLQGSELQEMSDEGMCMSMHQPWASLLVAGIKIHEGRSWYTTHRGCLWIAATAQRPSYEDIRAIEQSYRQSLGSKVQFPQNYPVGCLLGCVDVADCLSQELYLEQFPTGESDSAYVFICENARELLVKFPIKGRHKIYKLENEMHRAARKGLRRTVIESWKTLS